MNMRHIGFAEAFAALARTASANGSGLDVTATVTGQHKPFLGSSNREYKAVVSCGAASGTTPTLDLKIQDSPDNSNWTDISGATFTQLTTTGREEIHFRSNQRYLRCVATIAGTTPSFTFSVIIQGQERFS